MTMSAISRAVFIYVTVTKKPATCLYCHTRENKEAFYGGFTLKLILQFFYHSDYLLVLTFWRRNYFFFNFSTPCI